MSVSLWRWTEECDEHPCPGDCDLCEDETTMAKYKNIDDLVYLISDRIKNCDTDTEYLMGVREGLSIARSIIRKQPGDDVVEARYGRWKTPNPESNPSYNLCSECHGISYMRFNFCPNCGADMRGEK